MLPRRFTYARQQTLTGKLTETNTAELKLAHVPALATALKAALDDTAGKLGLLIAACDC